MKTRTIQQVEDEILYAKLKEHVGHPVQCVCYGDEDNPDNIAIECVECDCVILSADRPEPAPIRKQLTIPKELHNTLQYMLDFARPCDTVGKDDVIHTFTVKFTDHIEADIKVCNGDGPYIDSVLFKDGNEVNVLDVSDTLIGEYHFTHDDQEYIAELTTEKEAT